MAILCRTGTDCKWKVGLERKMQEKPLVLILCTGNSCRSHLAEGILRQNAGNLIRVESAGSNPAGFEPALSTRMRLPAFCRRMPSAKWLRHEFPVHKIRTNGFSCIFLSRPTFHLQSVPVRHRIAMPRFARVF